MGKKTRTETAVDKTLKDLGIPSISIDVEAFVVLHGGKDLVLTLFPEKNK